MTFIPGWSWGEDFDAAQGYQFAQRIADELRLRLSTARLLYALRGHPGYPPDLELLLDSKVAGDGLIKAVRKRRSNSYATFDRALFIGLLDPLFRLGPPEIAVMAISGDVVDKSNDLGALIEDVLDGNVRPGTSVCMSFDFGDLFRIE